MSPQPPPAREDDVPVSRRQFFTGAAFAPAAQAALKERKFYSSHVVLDLEGQYAGMLESAEGGDPVLVMPPPGSLQDVTVRYEPLKLRLADMSPAVYAWIAATLNGDTRGRNGAVITADAAMQETYRLSFQNARVVEVVLDSLDASVSLPVRFIVTIAPGLSKHVFGSGSTTITPRPMKSSPLRRSQFRLHIQGLEATTAKVVSIDPVGFSVPHSPEARGSDSPSFASGPILPLRLRFQLPLPDAGPMYKWMNDTLAGQGAQRGCELHLLDATGTRLVASVSFGTIMITRVSHPARSANDAQLVEVECQPTKASFNAGELVK
jgi:hypothetical protein